MAKNDRSTPREPEQDELVEKLVTDPSRVPEVQVLSGFVGKSARDGWLRLYLTPELSEYVEVPREDVLHHRRLDASENPLGGTLLWVKRDADIVRKRVGSREALAEFLQGDITAAYMSRIRAGGAVGGIGGGGLLHTFNITACASCPTSRGEDTCFPATCTLATSCYTTVITDKGCGGAKGFF